MFKRLIISLAVFCSVFAANAQGAYDALRFSQQHAEGTARSVAMGNAFVALGGDNSSGLEVNLMRSRSRLTSLEILGRCFFFFLCGF